MTKQDLERLVMECLHEYFVDAPPKSNSVKENTMKKSELKALVNEVVRQCVKEAGPQYKIQGKKSQVEQPGKVNRARQIQSEPEINEVAPPGGEDVVKALKKKSSVDNPWAVAWSMKKKGHIQQEADAPPFGGSEDESPDAHMGDDEHTEYDEQEEIRLLKAMAQAILVLLKMHKGMEEPEIPEEPEGEESSAEEPETSTPPSPPKAPEKKEKEEDELQESNHKVQGRSHKTVKDLDNDPKNVRDPEVPQA